MIQIIETTTGFGLKNVDAEGNSLGMREETFATHEEASAFIQSLPEEEGGTSAPEGTGTAPVVEEAPTAPTEETPVVPAEEAPTNTVAPEEGAAPTEPAA